MPNIRDMNLCLLASWIKKYNVDRDKIWKQITDFKYKTQIPDIFTCPSNIASPFLKGVIWASQVAKFGYMWQVGKGNKIRFWEDYWIGSSTLAIHIWALYDIVNG